ncbi:MAG: NAD(P)/FAD-dependent oxidoreductase [Nitrososphaerota archaeon]|nr:NAD(P)/FAD-dependent oxidoreductase [Nitrososphaerota archaeon]MDG6916697.1 NAD(P)/FAD-dependent oxidoreductase [Nitrososphaerota archaeon]MDG6917883.1 NAD(P)/FAD-dependent oxidoreductase [Nitrososphaerota archaeon]MDG6946406.1 NAD(P)/FAD-dependent oxidoreductase [Nitrososphaerota archaeon]
MPRILVVGSGTAGTAAVEECARQGADATVIDRLDEPEPPWASWPDLVGLEGQSRTVSSTLDQEPPSASILGTEVVAVREGEVVASNGSHFRADSVVIAAGSRFEPPTAQGIRKLGSFVLDSAARYEEFGSASASADRILICGEGARGLQVAERLSARGARPSLMVSSWQRGRPSPPVFDVVSDAARAKGIGLRPGWVGRVVGLARVEAVIAGGDVLPCDALAFIPRRVPVPIRLAASPGRSGGVLVDRYLRAKVPRVFAAGGCAELDRSLPPGATLVDEPRLSGRAAGANSAGGDISVGLLRTWSLSVFGLRWSRVGPDALTCESLGMDVREVGRRWSGSSACSLVYERGTGRVIGAEVIEPADFTSLSLGSSASGTATLRSLAYGHPGSSDISVVSDTARLGLKSWSRC